MPITAALLLDNMNDTTPLPLMTTLRRVAVLLSLGGRRCKRFPLMHTDAAIRKNMSSTNETLVAEAAPRLNVLLPPLRSSRSPTSLTSVTVDGADRSPLLFIRL